MKTFLLGDIHATHGIKNLNSTNFPEQKTLSKEDVVIQLGDFGLFWDNIQSKEEKYWLDWLAAKNFTFAFLDGNHENHQKMFDLPVIEKWGGKVGVYKTKEGEIYYLRRGEIYTINSKTFLVLGGARSHDKEHRTEWIDWWKTEELNYSEIENAFQNLEKFDNKVDFLLSHTTSEHVVHNFTENFMRFHDPVSQIIDNILNISEIKENHFGHFHNNRSVIEEGIKFQCHYGIPKEI